MTRDDVFLRCGNIVLEGILESPDELRGPVGAAVVCHPHPLFGGNMHNNVVRALRKAFLDRGMMCLRFNFRGTGRSEGSYGEGTAELEDVRAAMDFVSALDQVDVTRLVVAGYSFGCWVGLKAAGLDPRPGRLIGISPPVNEYDFSFLEAEQRPKLLVAGDNDFVCSESGFRRLAEAVPEPKTVMVFPGTDHFHVGREEAIVEAAFTFLDRFPFPGDAPTIAQSPGDS